MESSSAKNITYLLGAGASFYSLPIVSEIPQSIKELIKEIDSAPLDIITSDERIRGLIDQFLGNLSWICDQIGKGFTIDTFAKKLFLQRDVNLKEIKRTSSIYFNLLQSRAFEDKNWNKEVSLDYRYISFLASVLHRNEQEKLTLPDNVNVISWNYDTQLERAIAEFLNMDSVAKVFDDPNFKTFPFPGMKETDEDVVPKIVHLNGIAGLVEEGLLSNTESRFVPKFGKAQDGFIQILRKSLHLFDYESQDDFSFDNTFSFGWENSWISKRAVKYAKAIMDVTDILVVIGYSFPFFNREVDRTVLRSFFEKTGRKVYFQDPKLDGAFLKNQFSIEKDVVDIFHIQETSNFYLPYEL